MVFCWYFGFFLLCSLSLKWRCLLCDRKSLEMPKDISFYSSFISPWWPITNRCYRCTWWVGLVVARCFRSTKLLPYILRARLVLGWVTVCGQVNHLGLYPSRFVTSHWGQLSLLHSAGRKTSILAKVRWLLLVTIAHADSDRLNI